MTLTVTGTLASRVGRLMCTDSMLTTITGTRSGTSFSMGELRLESPVAAAQSDTACGEDEVSL